MAFRGHAADLGAEEVLRIDIRRHQTAGVATRQIRHQIGEEFEEDQEAVKRLLAQSVSLLKQLVKDCPFLVEVTLQQRLGQVIFVAEVIEETGL